MMHYAGDSFAMTPGTVSMYAKKPEFQHTMGSSVPAYGDFRTLNMYYGCKAACTAAQNRIKCVNQGIKNPKDCAQCICPK